MMRMEDGKDDDGDKAEEVVSNLELAEMLPTKTMKKSKKRGQNRTTTAMSTMKALSPRKIRAKQQSKLISSRHRATVHSFFEQIPPDEARVPLRVKRGHCEGDKYHNNYSSLEGRLRTAQNHKGAYSLHQKLLLLVKNETDIPQEDMDKARGHIPITDSDKKKAKLQAFFIKKMMNRMADEYNRQAFDQQIFDDLLLKYMSAPTSPSRLSPPSNSSTFFCTFSGHFQSPRSKKYQFHRRVLSQTRTIR
ncbi:hypothetical protein BT69DRAFT_1329903 [Atractiella rhizophila]|nr:hypothetical protein BT69DRAFT_1329903 [Atractiella rhizophila]